MYCIASRRVLSPLSEEERQAIVGRVLEYLRRDGSKVEVEED